MDYYVKYWVNKNEVVPEEPASHTPVSFWDDVTDWWNDFYEYEYFDIIVFGVLVLFTIVVSLSRSFVFFNACMKASRRLHNSMFHGISRATMYFFNVNPSGRILNRFSKDMGQIDEHLPQVMIDMAQVSLVLSFLPVQPVAKNVSLAFTGNNVFR